MRLGLSRLAVGIGEFQIEGSGSPNAHVSQSHGNPVASARIIAVDFP
jgi:hypothetical protein